jgi:membrane-bound lytic murein transglycosylase B
MSIELAKAFIRVRADASSVKKDIKAAQPGITSATSRLGAKIGTALAAAFGAAVIRAKATEAIQLATTQIQAEQKLAATIKATAGAAGFSADELKRFASDLQGITTFTRPSWTPEPSCSRSSRSRETSSREH